MLAGTKTPDGCAPRAHVATGADAKKEGSEVLLAWLGRPAALPLDSVVDNPTQAQKVLQLLTNNWPALSKEPRAREEAENAAMAAAEAACRTPGETSNLVDFAHASLAWLRDLPIEGPVHRCWTLEQKATVEKLLADFKEAHSTHEKALAEHLKSEDFAPVGLWLTRSLVAWTLFWIAFLFAFPWSRTIQAIFFWNPRARQFFSAGFVPLLLLILPPLRRRLLAPFRDDLVAPARLEDLPRLGYFADGRARVNGGEPVPLTRLQSGLRGVAVLQADSGLGKTSLLRETAAKAKRPVAFLHARDCADGVDFAISRVIHDVQETGFVRSLVHTRALIVIIDGLNEVSADTREKIGAFARDMSKGDVIVATQPIEWRPPPNSRIVELLPLDRREATAFIESRPVGADANQPCHGSAYKAAVQKFVSRALDEAPSELERETAALMLSNPFDLAFAAELLARGRMPSPTALIDEGFRLADERFREIAKAPFPPEVFGRRAVTMRLEDRNWLNPDEFNAEASCLLEQRLLVSRAVKGAQGVIDRRLFRHDRVWDFFIASAFAERARPLGGACRRCAVSRRLSADRRNLGPRERKESAGSAECFGCGVGRSLDQRRIHQAARKAAAREERRGSTHHWAASVTVLWRRARTAVFHHLAGDELVWLCIGAPDRYADPGPHGAPARARLLNRTARGQCFKDRVVLRWPFVLSWPE